MLTVAERRLARYLADRYFTDQGNIIDGGCFLGGSTTAFGLGLRAWETRHGRKPRHKIHAYDQFIAEAWMFDSKHLSADEFRIKQTLRPKFDEIIADVADLVEVHEGDIMAIGRPEEPVEILFIDVAKNPLLNDFIVRAFFPALIPGHSLVVQQDYLYDSNNAWIHITMEYYRDYFRMLTDTTNNSVVYLYETEIPAGMLQERTIDAMPAVEKVTLMRRARERFTGAKGAMLDRSHREYLVSRQWVGDDAAGHRAARAVAEYLLAGFARERSPDDYDDIVATCEALREKLAAMGREGDSYVELLATSEELRRKLEIAERRQARLERRLSDYETSTSWRLTAPVRAVRQLLKRG
jgi:hypothetical protein